MKKEVSYELWVNLRVIEQVMIFLVIADGYFDLYLLISYDDDDDDDDQMFYVIVGIYLIISGLRGSKVLILCGNKIAEYASQISQMRCHLTDDNVFEINSSELCINSWSIKISGGSRLNGSKLSQLEEKVEIDYIWGRGISRDGGIDGISYGEFDGVI
ncbi:MAG: hypothetical protein EZS28_000770 [Streblomastix strix]|uniref:Uncharacterized protein n=1 Tax=Streblomastix strix TaxID=222440 RepID=A0A5J4X979_9EUKA|nr:MAG: hypothetical protein EZS28_000770 [Streblomastix strix]